MNIHLGKLALLVSTITFGLVMPYQAAPTGKSEVRAESVCIKGYYSGAKVRVWNCQQFKPTSVTYYEWEYTSVTKTSRGFQHNAK